MSNIRARNQQILQMRQEGVSRQEVARRFGLSPWRIGLVEREFKTEEAMAERRARIRGELRRADDPDKMWAVEDLIDALRLSVLFRTRLLTHLDGIGKREMSVQELMDLAALVTNQYGFTKVEVSLWKLPGIGKIGFRTVIAQISEIDFGPRGNEIWGEKRAALRQYWRL
jgi:hypothetical protein